MAMKRQVSQSLLKFVFPMQTMVENIRLVLIIQLLFFKLLYVLSENRVCSSLILAMWYWSDTTM